MNQHLFFNSNWKLLLGHGFGLDHLSKLKPFNKTHLRNIDIDIFPPVNEPKQKRKSQHAKDQVELKLEVSHCTTNLEEDGTEVQHQEEALSNKPVPEGTEIPLRITNSTHYNQDNTSLKHQIMMS